ncbi:MAG: hypothetical protein AAFO79_12600, partial [Pseudomonadota bacterium]
LGVREGESLRVAQRQVEQLTARQQTLLAEQSRLTARAAFPGRVTFIANEAPAGAWMAPSTPVVHLVNDSSSRAIGLVSRELAATIETTQAAVFIPDDGLLPRREMAVRTVMTASDNTISDPLLTQAFGGDAATKEPGGTPVAKHGMVQVIASSGQMSPAQAQRGSLVLSAEGRSPFGMLWRSVAKVFVREHGF